MYAVNCRACVLGLWLEVTENEEMTDTQICVQGQVRVPNCCNLELQHVYCVQHGVGKWGGN